MEVHHHSHPSTNSGHRKKWTHYFWEFLMLFLAVFCGFLAEYQLEHKIEKDREKQFIRSLIEDLSEDTIILAQTATNLHANVKRMDSLKFLLYSDDIKDHGADLYYLGRRASRSDWLTLHDRTIQQMKNSGGFRLIRNQKVSNAILEYYNQLGFIEKLQTIELDETMEYRKMAVGIFHPETFGNLVTKENQVIKPDGNPPLQTYDKQALLRLAGFVSYCQNSRLALAKAEDEMNVTAKELIRLLKKEYHLK